VVLNSTQVHLGFAWDVADELLAYAARYDPLAVTELASLPNRSYGRIDEVGEALRRVQPSPSRS